MSSARPSKSESLMKCGKELAALDRVSVPEDVLNVVGGFLCSEVSTFVTGHTLVVDRGIVLSQGMTFSTYLHFLFEQPRLPKRRTDPTKTHAQSVLLKALFSCSSLTFSPISPCICRAAIDNA